MALVIEDGTIVAGANSYVTRPEIIAYAALRGVVIPDDAASDVFAIKAMDYLFTLCFKGLQIIPSLPFPRSELIDGDTADDWVFTIPDGIKTAQLQLAVDVFQGIDLTPSGIREAQVKSKKVGPIEKEFFQYDNDGLSVDPRLVIASAFLAPFMCAPGGFNLTTKRV